MLRQFTSTLATFITFSLVVGTVVLMKVAFVLEMMR